MASSQTDVRFERSRFFDDAILENVPDLAVAPYNLVSNVSRSGQLGTGIRITKLDGATPAVFNPTVGVVLQTPSMWNNYPKLQESLKALMETHAKSITNIDFGYTLDTDETPVGHDGQTMKVPTRVQRGAVSPSATFIEYTGNPVYNLFRHWMFCIQHPDTNASILPAFNSDVSQIPAWYMSSYSMSMLFIQYDPSGLPDRIYDAAVIVNMFPTNIGDIGFERTIGTTQTKERTIEFTGLVQHNENTRELGVRVAEMLQLHKINYQFALPGLGGTADPDMAIQSELRTMGGLEYEAGPEGHHNMVEGAIKQYKFLGEGGNEAYEAIMTGGSDKTIPQTGAAEASSTNGEGQEFTTLG